MKLNKQIIRLLLVVNMGFFMPVLANDANILQLEQNWSDKEREFFYFADQGSRLIPYDYFLHLEEAESSALFRRDQNMLRMGFIPAKKSKNNPDGLAIGLARNGNAMGPTCAACHTQQISYKNQLIRIDGGQAFIDLQMFLKALTASIKATLDNDEKFMRFQQRVLGKNANQQQQDQLKQALYQQYEKRRAYALENHTAVPYGYARLDAFGGILNRALVITGEKDNTNSPNAPTSHPYLWDTPQHDYVEWNGSQSNTGVGALARNIGEVIGVFGEIEADTTRWLALMDGGYASSVQAGQLRKLEHLISRLHSPLWPASFPKIDENQAKRGRALYERHCIECHVDIKRTDPLRLIKVRMSSLDEIKTDRLMAENALFFKGKTGKFEGRPRYYVAGEPLLKQTSAIYIANNLMVGIIKNNPLQSYLAKRDARKLGHADINHPPKYVDGKIIAHGKEVSDHALLAYKARPLNGIWTSAPFLHNGSVPNLYELLLPANQRAKQFYLGTQEFDVKHVGYAQTPAENDFLFDTTLAGNSNAGHEYGTGYGDLPALTEEERWSLIEYLKTL